MAKYGKKSGSMTVQRTTTDTQTGEVTRGEKRKVKTQPVSEAEFRGGNPKAQRRRASG